MSNEIRAKVTEILAHVGVAASAAYKGEGKDESGSGRTWDKWCFAFERGGARPVRVEFDFFTDLGHRKAPRWGPGAGGYAGGCGTGPVPRPGSLLYAEWQKQVKPQAPHPADVLHSLILESSAADQSFDSWCGDFDCDPDSRRALATYEACQQNVDKLRRFFTREALDALTEALQDY